MYTVEAPCDMNLDCLKATSLNNIFSHEVREFLAHLSQTILQLRESFSYPELIAVAYWMRKSNIEKLSKEMYTPKADAIRLPRGIAFHIVPGNVETIFLYSWILSMLAGNHNIIRISSKPSQLMEIILRTINKVSIKHNQIAKTFMIIRYAHDDEITKDFSAVCDLRIIWGGDKTIQLIRSIPIKPSATEIMFTSKFSLALINAEALIKETTIESLIVKFYNDVYTFNQMGCSSPRLIVWHGNQSTIDLAQKKFWEGLEQYCFSQNREIEPSLIIDKIAMCQLAAAEKHTTEIRFHHPYISRMKFDKLSNINFNDHSGGGLFYEVNIQSLEEIISILERHIQTLSVFGYQQDDLMIFFNSPKIRGVDRVVPIGDSLNFSNNWDGYALFNEFTRQITVNI